MADWAGIDNFLPPDFEARLARAWAWTVWLHLMSGSKMKAFTADDPIRAGTTGVVHGPLLVRVPFRILTIDAIGRRWSWRVGPGPLGLRMEHGVDEQPTGSRAWVRIGSDYRFGSLHASIIAYSSRCFTGNSLRCIVGM